MFILLHNTKKTGGHTKNHWSFLYTNWNFLMGLWHREWSRSNYLHRPTNQPSSVKSDIDAKQRQKKYRFFFLLLLLMCVLISTECSTFGPSEAAFLIDHCGLLKSSMLGCKYDIFWNVLYVVGHCQSKRQLQAVIVLFI